MRYIIFENDFRLTNRVVLARTTVGIYSWETALRLAKRLTVRLALFVLATSMNVSTQSSDEQGSTVWNWRAYLSFFYRGIVRQLIVDGIFDQLGTRGNLR